MAVVRQLVTQSGVDVGTWVGIQTGLTADGKSGWQVKGMEAFWVDGSSVAAGDYQVSAVVGTVTTVTTPADDDEILRVSWGLQNTAGVAVAVPYEPIKKAELVESRVTVQPLIYASVQSSASGQANDVVLAIYYDIIKLSDNEVLRMLIGGA